MTSLAESDTNMYSASAEDKARILGEFVPRFCTFVPLRHTLVPRLETGTFLSIVYVRVHVFIEKNVH